MVDVYKADIENLQKIVVEKKLSKIEIDNEYCRMLEKYGLESRLNSHGVKVLRKILDKFWTGKRLDDQELTIAFGLCPKIVLYDKIVFRVLDMVTEIESECTHRWGVPNPPMKSMLVIKQMVEYNPDYETTATPLINAIWTGQPLEEVVSKLNEIERTVEENLR